RGGGRRMSGVNSAVWDVTSSGAGGGVYPGVRAKRDRNDVEIEPVNQYSDAWVSRKSSSNRPAGSPAQSHHARYFSRIHASRPAGESDSPWARVSGRVCCWWE